MSEEIEVIATSEDGKRRCIIAPDYMAEYADPRQDDGNVSVMAFWHREYRLGDPGHWAVRAVTDALGEHAWPVVERWMRAFLGATEVIPIGMIDHSGISIYAGGGAHPLDPGGWDSGTVGIAFDLPETRALVGKGSAREAILSEISTYAKYLRGEVYVIGTQNLVTWTSDTGQVRQEWETYESCGGYLGYDYALRCAKEDYPL